MGDALVVHTIPEEMLIWPQLQRELRRRQEHSGSGRKRKRVPAPNFQKQAMSELRIPEGGIWEPPAEPDGHEWWRSAALRHRHAEAVRRSLEAFLNGHLAGLNHMLRTGWWVLGKVRVRVVECRPVSERKMRAQLRAFDEFMKPPKARPASRRARRRRLPKPR